MEFSSVEFLVPLFLSMTQDMTLKISNSSIFPKLAAVGFLYRNGLKGVKAKVLRHDAPEGDTDADGDVVMRGTKRDADGDAVGETQDGFETD
jgi:hypothetical protein